MFRAFEHRQVYHPRKEWEAHPSDLGRAFEDIYFSSPDGLKLNAWFFPADDTSLRRAKVILVCHGNGGNISNRLMLCQVLLQLGLNVLVFDYRGYGRSEGRPSEDGTYLDAQTAYQWLRQRGFAARDIVVFGESLGGGVASELAVREPVGGLILQSTFTSIPDVGAELFRWLPVRWLNKIHYHTWKKLPQIKVPVLVMHSRDDTLVRFHHAEKNFTAANEPKLFHETSGGHNYSLATDPRAFAAGMEKFLKLLGEVNQEGQ